MIVTAWKNSKNQSQGAGYGLKVSQDDRDRYFQQEWKSVILELEGIAQQAKVNIAKASFWDGTCRELISSEIRRWLLQNKLAPWPKSRPLKLLLKPLGGNRFRLKQSGTK